MKTLERVHRYASNNVVLAVAALLISFAIGGMLSLLPQYMSGNDAIWYVINYLGWYWWSIAIGLSAIGLWYMFKLSAPRTMQGTVARLFLYIGFTGYLFCWGNNALGPVSAVFVIAGTVLMIRQLAGACDAQRKVTNRPGAPFTERVLMALVEELPR